MRSFAVMLMSLVSLGSFDAQATYRNMSFKIRSLGEHQYDYSAVWNDSTQEATLRIGLVSDIIDPTLQDQNLLFASAKRAEMSVLDVPEMAQDCDVISNWQFEYLPGMQSHLMQITLKGLGCKRLSEVFDILQVRLRFYGLPVVKEEPIDVAVDISR